MKTITFEVEDELFADLTKLGGEGQESDVLKTAFIGRDGGELHNQAEKIREEELEAEVKAIKEVRAKADAGQKERIDLVIKEVEAEIAVVEAQAVAEQPIP